MHLWNYLKIVYNLKQRMKRNINCTNTEDRQLLPDRGKDGYCKKLLFVKQRKSYLPNKTIDISEVLR